MIPASAGKVIDDNNKQQFSKYEELGFSQRMYSIFFKFSCEISNFLLRRYAIFHIHLFLS